MLFRQLFGQITLEGAVLIAALAFLARQAWTIGQEYVAERRRRVRFIAALYAEIAYNTADLRRFIAESRAPEAVAQVLNASASKALHMTDARHTAIYALNVERLSLLPQIAILDVVAFYNQLEKIKVQVDALGQQSFRDISDEGRLQVLTTLWSSIETGRALGDMALFRFETEGKLSWAIDRPVIEKNGAQIAATSPR